MGDNTILYVLITLAAIVVIFYLMKCKIECSVVPPPLPPNPVKDICQFMYYLCMNKPNPNENVCYQQEQKCLGKLHHESYRDDPLLFPDEILL